MRNKTVVRKTYNEVATLLCFLALSSDPRTEFGAYLAPRLMLLKLLGVVVGTVAAGVYGDESDAVAGACNIGELAGFLALRRGELATTVSSEYTKS